MGHSCQSLLIVSDPKVAVIVDLLSPIFVDLDIKVKLPTE
jgi:hypothetical protein